MKMPKQMKVGGYTLTEQMGVDMIKYMIVGFSTFALDYFLNWVMIDVIGVNYLIVGIIIAPVVLGFNFISHRLWTFRSVGSAQGKTKVQMVRYIVLIIFNALANVVLMWVFYGQVGLPLFWARVVCTMIGVMWTFPVSRLWVYKPSEKLL